MGEWFLSVLLISLVGTIGLEMIFAWLVGVRERQDIILVILVNIVTNPCVVLTYYLIIEHTNINAIISKVILELGAIMIEAYFYSIRACKIKKTIKFAFCANVFSYFIGAYINYLVR